jgi:hypothetical protein
LFAIELTDSVSSRHTPDTPRTVAWPPSRPSVPTSRATRHLVGERAQLLDHRVHRVLELEDLALDVDRDRLGQVALRDRSRHARDLADLRRQVRRH